ncbi:MAG: insulinase family protein, partial [Candidatus Eremiobacteraeota bacterium]|nr:insulinase family protein [Candidatus Eremiobacteraeota bacterium]
GLRYPTALSVASISRDDLLAYSARYWRPDLTTLAIVGDITPQQARREVEAAFGSWNATGQKPDASESAFPGAQGGEDYVGTAANQVYVRLGQPAIARTGADFYAFSLLSEIIGGSGNFESRLWQELRQKRGLVYSVDSSFKSSRDRGEFRVEMSASPDKTAGAVRIVRGELERLQREPVTQTELEEAKTRLVSGALLAQESSQGQADELLDLLRNDLPTNYYATLNDRYAGITAADLQRVAKTYLHPDKLIEVFSGPVGPWATHPI